MQAIIGKEHQHEGQQELLQRLEQLEMLRKEHVHMHGKSWQQELKDRLHDVDSDVDNDVLGDDMREQERNPCDVHNHDVRMILEDVHIYLHDVRRTCQCLHACDVQN